MTVVRAVGAEVTGRPPAGAATSGDRRIPSHVRETRDLAGLAVIQRRGVNLALWHRTLPAEVAANLAEAVSAGLPTVRLETSCAELAAELGSRLPPGPGPSWLAADAAMLARTFSRLAGTNRVTVRIEAIDGDACRFFHADAVALRLVTAYQGRGTQWLADVDADAFRGDAVPEELVRETDTGTVAVFKGLRGATGGHPLVHRSPPRQAGDPVRLFLAFDPAAS